MAPTGGEHLMERELAVQVLLNDIQPLGVTRLPLQLLKQGANGSKGTGYHGGGATERGAGPTSNFSGFCSSSSLLLDSSCQALARSEDGMPLRQRSFTWQGAMEQIETLGGQLGGPRKPLGACLAKGRPQRCREEPPECPISAMEPSSSGEESCACAAAGSVHSGPAPLPTPGTQASGLPECPAPAPQEPQSGCTHLLEPARQPLVPVGKHV